MDISSRECIIDSSGFGYTVPLFDGNFTDSVACGPGAWFTAASQEGFGSLYLLFDLETGGYTITDADTGVSGRWGEDGFLHEFVDLEGFFGYAPKTITVTFENGACIVETYFFTSGSTPDFVQKWEPPADGCADLMVMPTHCDDEQLFLGGITPLYAAQGKTVQVVYLTDHRNMTRIRCREALDGLWAVGCRTYPVFGPFPDARSFERDEAYLYFSCAGITREELVGFVVEQFRRFRPKVVAGHDVLGEYWHGQHMAYADMVMAAAELSADPEQYPESAENYGVWDVPKVYLHLWKENPIVLDLDQPMEELDGLSPYRITKERGYPAHASQYKDFLWYLQGHETAASITRYSPCEYGLFRSLVGPDVEKNDFFENIE